MNETINKYIGYIVSETHWDREWYLTFQEFRKWLVRLIDKLIKEFEHDSDFKAFMLDGQTLVLEDYLEIRPYNFQKLKELIEKERIQVGPWYCLADEFLESGEGIIRNLLLGHKIGKEFGRVMKVGYMPDTFGHIWQLPQILKGFDIKYGYGMRGYPPVFGNHEEYENHNDNTPLEHIWASPNPNEKILMLHHITGYGNAGNLCDTPMIEPDGSKLFMGGIAKIDNSIHRSSHRKKSSIYLFMNGGDHCEPEFELPEFVQRFNSDEEIQEDIPITLRHGTLEEYFDELNKQNLDLPTLTGEWRGSMYTQVTPGCTSTRMYLKKQNYECQKQLEKYSEPFSSMSWLFNGTYDSDFIWESWKWVIKNHPHDSICGCSLDRVHDDMETRFKWSLDISQDMALNAMAEISTGIDEKKLLEIVKSKQNISVNTHEIVTIFNPIAFPDKITQIVEGYIPLNPGYDYRIFDYTGNEFEDFVLKMILDYRNVPDAQSIFKILKGNWACGYLSMFISDLPQLGYKSYILIGSAKNQNQNNLAINENSISNQDFTVKVFRGKDLEVKFHQNGSFLLNDLETGIKYDNLNLFEDMADDGDEYDYSPLREEIPLISNKLKAEFKLIEENAMRSVIETNIEFPLPKGLIELDPKTRIRDSQLKILKIRSEIKIYHMIKRVDIKTSFENIIKSHRLRALFPTGIDSDYSYADDHFMVMKRTIKLPRDDGWFQDMQGIYHQDTFVDINNGQYGLTVLNKGIPEFEIIDLQNLGLAKNTIALTLVRGVEWLSQRGHLGRKSGLNGPNFPTPGAQCLRYFEFEYSIYPHQGSWMTGKSYPNAYSYNYSPQTFDKKQENNVRVKKLEDLPPEFSFIESDNDNIIITCMKKAEFNKNGAILVRFFNPTDIQQTVKFSIPNIFKKVSRCNMLEETNSNSRLMFELIADSRLMFELIVNSSEIYSILLEK